MIHGDKNAVFCIPSATCATNATQAGSFDTKGYDHANVYVHIGTCATNGTTISTLKFTEHDTTTSASSMSAIVALTGGTATSSSVGFVIPAVTSIAGGGCIEFQIDLRARKRYLGLQITHGATTLYTGAVAVLSRSEASCDTTTTKRETNLAATNVKGVISVVTA